MSWLPFLVCDLDGALLGEIANPRDRGLSWRVNRAATVKVTLDLTDPLSDRLLAGDAVIKVFEDDALRFVGEVDSSDEVVTEATKRVASTFVDPVGGLATRLIGKSVAGYTPPAPTDRGAIVDLLLDEANAEDDTHLRIGTLEASSADTPGPWYYKPLSEVLAELSAPLDGYDWQVDPVDFVADASGRQWGELNIFAAMGTLRPDAVFAYSDDVEDRGNVKGYTRNVTKAGMVNDGYSLPPGFPDVAGGNVENVDNLTSQARWGLRQAVIPSDLADPALRSQLVAEHVAVRGGPRQAIKIDGFLPNDIADAADAGKPIPAAPQFRVDFDLGDVVPFRATINGQTRVDGLFRVYGVDVAINDEGEATPSLFLTPDEGG